MFFNLNPEEPRVWVTSESFALLLARYGREVGLPCLEGSTGFRRLGQNVLQALVPGRPRPSPYDLFMLRFHHFLKSSDEFQERCPKRFWTFPPGSAWLALTDGFAHAVLRGRHALEHSYFVKPEVLLLPSEAPLVLLEWFCGLPQVKKAA
jgi:hypothetical protein